MEENIKLIFEQNSDIIMSIDVLKMMFIVICTYFLNFKLTNQKIKINLKFMMHIFCIIVFTIICSLLRYEVNFILALVCLVFLTSIIFDKENIVRSVLITIVSLSINYIIFFIAIIINFFINILTKVNNDWINFIIICLLQIILLNLIFKIKKFKYGIFNIQNKTRNEYLDVLLLNISITVLFVILIIVNTDVVFVLDAIFVIIVSMIIMFITIQKSLQLYYKQRLLIQELEETKSELEVKKKEVEELEKENLEFSKTSHTLAHKQRILEHKIDELSNKSKTEKEINKEEENNIKATVQEISKKLYTDVKEVELYKTEIPEIDDILRYTQSECTKNNIEFNVQIRGKIYKMINNVIPKEELQILIADHVKNAIIAINYSENINRSILIQIGKIMGNYGLYIYDSGIEFEKETLENLGKKPSTTHAEEGGTGMGFMNTFDTLRKYKASLEIEEIGKPSKDNYTKILKIKFDGKEEYKVKTYR